MKITWKKWGSLLLALALVLSLAPPVQAAPAREGNTTQFFSGLGTKESPYIISTKEHLNNVRLYPDSYFKMGADIVFTEEDFGEGGAYYGNGQGWQPIGSKSTPFTGTFDGDGHTITGLRIHIDTPDVVCAGLFGYVKNGTIANLGMENSKIQVVDCRGFVGGVAGHVSGSAIYNCYYTGMISSSTKAGGIAGWLERRAMWITAIMPDSFPVVIIPVALQARCTIAPLVTATMLVRLLPTGQPVGLPHV